jgi:hypothetical protein
VISNTTTGNVPGKERISEVWRIEIFGYVPAEKSFAARKASTYPNIIERGSKGNALEAQCPWSWKIE